MGEVVDIRQGINILLEPGATRPYSEELDVFMSGLDRERTLGKLETDSKYWESRLDFLRFAMERAQTARKSATNIASDALSFIEREPEKFAELPAEQQTMLRELAGRVITDTEE